MTNFFFVDWKIEVWFQIWIRIPTRIMSLMDNAESFFSHVFWFGCLILQFPSYTSSLVKGFFFNILSIIFSKYMLSVLNILIDPISLYEGEFSFEHSYSRLSFRKGSEIGQHTNFNRNSLIFVVVKHSLIATSMCIAVSFPKYNGWLR